jgi:hypothetical protein
VKFNVLAHCSKCHNADEDWATIVIKCTYSFWCALLWVKIMLLFMFGYIVVTVSMALCLATLL